MLDNILAKLKLKPKTFVAATFSELPADVQREVREEQGAAEHEVKGVFHNGTLYLVSGNLESGPTGICLVLTKKFVRHIARRVINDVFPDYIDVWKELNA